MTIGGENDPPDAVNDLGLHVREGAGPTPLAVLTNDDDPDGNDLTIKSVTAAAHGTVTITGNGTGLTLPAGEVVPRHRHVHLHRRRRPRVDRQGHRAGHRRQGCRRAGGGRAAPAVPRPDHRHGLGQGADLVVGVGSGLGGHPLHAPGERQWRHVQDRGAPAGDDDLASTRRSATAGRTGSGSGPSTTRATPAPTPTARRSASGSTRSPMRRSPTPRAGARSSARRPSAVRRASRVPRPVGDAHHHRDRHRAGGDPHVQQRARPRSTWTAVLVATLNLHRSSTAYRQLIYARHFATLEAHTFEVRAVGDGRVELDAFEILR